MFDKQSTWRQRLRWVQTICWPTSSVQPPSSNWVLHAGEVLYWDLVEGNVVKRIRAHTGVVCSLAMHPQGSHLLTSALDGVVKVWAAQPPKARSGRGTWALGRRVEEEVVNSSPCLQYSQDCFTGLPQVSDNFVPGNRDKAVGKAERAASMRR
eukprot:1160639-Pelagomonas_calceolata.AAC.6